MTSMTPRSFLVFFFCFLTAAGLAGCNNDTAPLPPRPVLTMTVTPVTTEIFGPFSGTVQARYQTQLGFQTSGRMVARDVYVSDLVKKGQRLAALDPTIARFVSIPLVLAVTFIVLDIWGISLQRISLGALIIALGLLVDDAMITVEMMVARLEAGDTKTRAATFAYTSTAFPMLTGTLVTVAGFLPIGFNASAAGEYTFSLFVVITVALLISWIVAVLFAPLVGVALLPATMRQHGDRPSRFLTLFRALLMTALSWRRFTIGMTLAALALSILAYFMCSSSFFPHPIGQKS